MGASRCRTTPHWIAERRQCILTVTGLPVSQATGSTGVELSSIQPLKPPSGVTDVPARWPLPDDLRRHIRVPEMVPEPDDPGLATRAWGFPALDDIGLLRQHEPRMLDGDLVLFEPAGDGEAQHRRSGWASAVAAGWSQSQRDLPTDAAVTFPDMIQCGDRTMAPTVSAGTYGVRLKVGAAVARTEVVLKRHPWIEGVTAQDLVARSEFRVPIRDEVVHGHRTEIATREVAVELVERVESVAEGHNLMAADGAIPATAGVSGSKGMNDDETLMETAERSRPELNEVAGDIHHVRIRPILPGRARMVP